MPRIVCPGCEKALKVRDDSTAKAVRCPACGEKISLEPSEAAEIQVAEAPRKERDSRPSSKVNPARPAPDDSPPPRKANRRPPAAEDDDEEPEDRPRVRTGSVRLGGEDEDDDDEQPANRPRRRKGTRWHSLGTRWHGLLPLVILVVLGVFLAPVVFLFPRYGGGALVLLASIACPLAFVMTLVGMYRKGIVNDLAGVSFLLRRVALIYLFFRYPFEYPKLLLCWVSLLFLGIAMGAGGSFVTQMAMRGPPPQMPDILRQPPGNGGANSAAANGGGGSDVNQLFADLGSGNDNSCRVAAEKLATMKPDEHQAAVAQKLAGLVNTPNPFTRGAVMQALGVWATPAEVPVLIQALNSNDRPTRRAVLQNIGKLRDERTVAPVVNCLAQMETQDLAAAALRDMGPMAEKDVLGLLNDRDGFVRLAAIKVLKDIGTQASVPALQAVVDGKDIILAGPAQAALAAINARPPK